MKKTLILAAVAATLAAGVAANGADKISLTGAGATFPYPLYSKWFSEYDKLHPDVEVNYQSIGSGGGIKQITERTVDFGASDAPMLDEELAKAPGILHIPTTLGAVVVTWKLDGVSGDLKLDPKVLGDIYLGKVRKWNDAEIAKDNPGVKLPGAAIAVVHRSDGSGTTNVFTDYLSHVNADWKSKVGMGKSVSWPVGIGAKGNEGVAGQMEQLKNSIGYVELAYAEQNKLPVFSLKNHDGNWVTASPSTITEAAAGYADKMPADLRVSIVDAPGKTAYPISAFTYILVYQDQKDPAKGKAIADLLWWAIHDGQQFNESLSYAKLPPAVVAKDEAKIRSLTANGKPLLTGS